MFKFSENETLESLDGVPDNIRSFYAEADGQYVINDSLRSAAEAFDNINSVNHKLRKDLKSKVPVDMSALSEYGTSPEEIAESFQAKITELSEVIDSKKNLVNPEKIRQQMTEGFEKTKSEYEHKLEAYKAQYYDLAVTNQAMAAISAEKGDAELLMPFITQQVRMVEEDGKLKARVMDADGEVRIGGMGSPMTVKELVQSMKNEKKFAKLFESQQTTGGGTPTSRNHQSVQPGVPMHERDSVANIKAGLMKRGMK